MGKLVKAARIAVAVAAWLAANTSFATETITATGGNAGAVAGAVAGSSSGATSSATGGNPSATVEGGSTRALGLGAAVSPATCYGSVLGGLAVWSSPECIRDQQFRQLRAINDDAAREFLCQVPEQRRALVAAGLTCRTQAEGAKMPVFQTGTIAAGGYDAYKPFQYAE